MAEVNVTNTEETVNKSEFGNRFGNNNEEKANSEKGTKTRNGYTCGEDRPHITSSTGDDEQYWGVSIESNLVSKNQIRSNISNKLQQIFNDFIGCNLFLEPGTGRFRLMAFFGPSGVNPDAPVKAFDQETELGVDKAARPLFEMQKLGNRKRNIYKVTKQGHGILSDLVPATFMDIDKNGWVKNFDKFFWEVSNTPVQVNGYMANWYAPQNSNLVWAGVELDITKVMRLCKNRIDEKNKDNHQYDYQLTATNIVMIPQMILSYAQQEADFIIRLEEIDSTEMANMCRNCGIGYNFANLTGVC